MVTMAIPLADQPLFDPAAVFGGRPFDAGFYLVAVFLYVIHAPLQELVARAGLQGTWQNHPDAPGKHQLESNSYLQSAVRLGAFIYRLLVLRCSVRARHILGLDVRQTAFPRGRLCFPYNGCVWAIFVVGVRGIIGGD